MPMGGRFDCWMLLAATVPSDGDLAFPTEK